MERERERDVDVDVDIDTYSFFSLSQAPIYFRNEQKIISVPQIPTSLKLSKLNVKILMALTSL